MGDFGQDFILPSGQAMSTITAIFEQKYAEHVPENDRDLRSNTDLTFCQFLLTQEMRGEVEGRPIRRELSRGSNRWPGNIGHLAGSLNFELDATYKDAFPPNRFEFPIFGTTILSKEQELALNAWHQWAEFLQLDSDNLFQIETALETIWLNLHHLGRRLILKNLHSPLKIIVENFREKFETVTVNGKTIPNGDCQSPMYLIMGYSEVIREAELKVVPMIKKWLRMATRRTVRENLNELLQIVYRIPIEICDIHRNVCHNIIGEIKQLICLQYVAHDGQQIEDTTPRLTHLHRPNTLIDYLEFNYKIQKANSAYSYALQPDRGYLRAKLEQVNMLRNYNQVHEKYEWKKHQRKIALLGNNNDMSQENFVSSFSELLANHGAEMTQEIIDNFPRLTVESYNAEAYLFSLRDSDSDSSGTNSEDTNNSSNMSEYTLPSTSESENSIPSYEDLMQPE